MSFVGRDSLEITLLAMKALFLDEEPDLAFQDIVDLFRFVSVGLGMVTGCSYRNHEATFISVALFDDHGAVSRLSPLNSLSPWYFVVFHVKCHFIRPSYVTRKSRSKGAATRSPASPS
jgi:hypothetical protein